jgi:SAM-dependent methyltransferase
VAPNVALMQFLIEARDRDEADRVLHQVRDLADASGPSDASERLTRVARLWQENPQAFATVKAVLAHVEHGGTAPSPEEGVAHWAALFDRMAQTSPEGGVALYALGNPALLQAATAEVADRLRSWALLGPDKCVLEIGCGIGRFLAALAPEVRRVTGIDISPVMIDRARERCAGSTNVAVQVSSGQDLAPFADESFDLVLAADVFPYLVQAGAALVERHLQESARVLRPAGSLVVLNYSYRGDPEQDRVELAVMAGRSGLSLAELETGGFSLWDAAAFRLLKV